MSLIAILIHSSYIRRIKVTNKVIIELNNIQVVIDAHPLINGVDVIESAADSWRPPINIAGKV
jgi:hypothetical protein